MSDLVGKQLGEFRLIKLIGTGGMADVYLANQTTLNRNAAVKVLKPALMAASPDRMVARFQQEATMAAGLNHPNIVQVYTIGKEDGYHFIAQEFVQGQDLATILKLKGAPQLGPALHVMRQVASALSAAGQAGIVHRDIKPENILVSKKGIVKVADFGLAQLHATDEDTSLTQEGTTLGTPLYMSPEQVRGLELDPRTDIYSFGITCYRLLSNRLPFTGTTATGIAVQHLTTAPPPLADENPELPDAVCRMVHRMMAKEIDQRYPTAEDVLTDIKELQNAIKQGRSLDLIRLPRLTRIEQQLKRLSGSKDTDSSEKKASPPDDAPLPVRATAKDAFVAVKVVDHPETYDGDGRRVKTIGGKPWVTLPSWEEQENDNGSFGRRITEFEELDLTPMVDVTFLLLIFFMITAAFNLQKKFDIPPSRSEEAALTTIIETSDEAAIEVEIGSDNRVYFDDFSAETYDEILAMLTTARRE